MIGFMIKRGTYCLETDGEKRCLTLEEPVILSDEDLSKVINYVEEENFEELEKLLKSLEGERKVTLSEVIDITEDLGGDLTSLIEVIDDVMFNRLINDSEVNALTEDVKKGLVTEEDLKYIVERIIKEMLGKAYEELMRFDENFIDELLKAIFERY